MLLMANILLFSSCVYCCIRISSPHLCPVRVAFLDISMFLARNTRPTFQAMHPPDELHSEGVYDVSTPLLLTIYSSVGRGQHALTFIGIGRTRLTK